MQRRYFRAQANYKGFRKTFLYTEKEIRAAGMSLCSKRFREEWVDEQDIIHTILGTNTLYFSLHI